LQLFFSKQQHSTQQLYEQAMLLWRKAAELGSGVAMFWLGQLYYNGQGSAQDGTEALKWFQKGAASNDLASMLALSELVCLEASDCVSGF
jgi:TPR repeat protein